LELAVHFNELRAHLNLVVAVTDRVVGLSKVSTAAVWARGSFGANLNHAGAAAGVGAVLVGVAFSGEEIVEGFIDLVDAFAECSVSKSGT
jgi:hypothetical protein